MTAFARARPRTPRCAARRWRCCAAPAPTPPCGRPSSSAETGNDVPHLVLAAYSCDKEGLSARHKRKGSPMNRLKPSLFLVAALALSSSQAVAQVDIDLAGNALPQFPFFEFVRAFNANAPVQVAIDPTRSPGVV